MHLCTIAMTPTTTFDARLLVASLNRCIEACIDAQRAYGNAAAMARDGHLKDFFHAREDERGRFVQDLQRAVIAFGAFPENRGTLRGAARRRLMDITRDLVPRHDDHRVMAELLREERAAIDAYEAAMPEARVELMSPDLRVALREQRGAMELAYDELSHRIAA